MTSSTTKPRLSFWQIWNMSFGFMGIQFGFALQNANVSRIFETLGADIESIPILWIAAPVTGLIIQPIIGHMSDNTWNSLGRRRPYFLVGAILASLSLVIMPNSPMLWVAAGMLWIMDASINVSMEPFRAFVGDMLPSDQRTAGFAMQSFFIGVGAVVASALPYIMTNWLGIANTAAEGEIPPSVRYAFYIGAVVFITAVLVTVITTKEYSPEELAQFDGEESLESTSMEQIELDSQDFQKRGYISLPIGAVLTALVWWFGLDKELYIGGVGLIVYAIIQFYCGMKASPNTTPKGLLSIIHDLNTMPKTMGQLAIVQFFSWFSLFAMWIYSTAAVTSHVYGTTDTTSTLYNDGADWVGVLFAVYNGFSAIVAFALPVLAKWTNRKTTHMISLIAGGVGFLSFYFFKDPNLLIISMLGVGLAWSSILAMPYAILSGALPSNKMGVYMGIFNFFIVIPQIVAASILGFAVQNFFGGESIYALILGGVSMLIAAGLTLLVDDDDDQKNE